eukprot:m.114839 g.114839  ORF g.114839 m.114839 type:complete len:66 (-) comp13067_c0_seq1:357-554(-)
MWSTSDSHKQKFDANFLNQNGSFDYMVGDVLCTRCAGFGVRDVAPRLVSSRLVITPHADWDAKSP